MPQRKIRSNPAHQYNLYLLIFIILFLSSCLQKNDISYQHTKRQLQIADSLITAGKNDSSLRLILKTRAEMLSSDPSIATYYGMRARAHISRPEIMILYADSALAFFNSESRINQYPNEYFNTLLIKGDACLKVKKYIEALNYYFKARKVLPSSDCDNGDLDTKLGGIYYSQKNFKLAARYWADSYNRLLLCHNSVTAEKLFEMEEGSLNNAGFSYERAGILDSANYFYLKNLQLIKYADSAKLTLYQNIKGAKIVLYDNLGGLKLKQGDFISAEKYLTACIAIPNLNTDGIKIPPLLKLADLYLKTGQYEKLAEIFIESRALLNLFKKDNPDSEIKWNKLFAQYLFKLHQADKAYLYQDRYIKLRDSVDNSSSELYRLDVERELSGISQRQELIELEQKDKIRIIYLGGISIIGILSIIIIILINRNLKRAEKNHKSATQHNQQLQHTLDELERVNKNYIRIMRVMAHDLRNPLSGITGLAAMLLDEDEFSEDSKHMLRLIESTGLHTMEMINELLKSGLADENAQLQKHPVDLRALLYDSVELLQFRANEKQQQLVFESSDLPIVAGVNHENIWRVFNNLIVNAIKFSHDGGIIRIEIQLKKDHILISIADNGIGIPDKDKDNVFEMFTPAKKAGTNGEEPFGLGLSISKRIIEKHDGKIWFKSEPGNGTIFYIELPC